jgi:hypothetical protein
VSQPPNPSDAIAAEQAAKRASRKIDEAFEEAAKLAGSDLPPTNFYQDLLTKVLGGIDAPAGAIWLKTPQGFLQLQCQINIEAVNIDRHKGGRQSHNELLRQAFQAGKTMLLEPFGSTGIHEGLPAGNPTEFVVLLAPIQVEKETVGLIEIWTEPRWDVRVQRTCLNYLVQMAGFASAYVKNQQGRKLVGQEQLWSQLEVFARDIHSSLDPTRVAYQIANEGRRLIGCDRVSVGVVHDKKAKIEAVSGSDVVEKRSSLIQTMRRLCDAVLAWGEKLVYQGTQDESLPPDVLQTLDDYLAESNSKLLVVQPLRDERQKDLPGPARSVLVMECFEPPTSVDPLISRMEVVSRHATSALYNAAEIRRIPLRWLWQPIAKVQAGLGGKTKAIIIAIVAGVGLLIAAMVVVPYPLKLEANGQLLPRERQKIFPPHEGIVKQFLVKPNDTFGAGHNLAILLDYDLQSKLDTLAKEIEFQQNSVAQAQSQISSTTNPDQRNKAIGERDKAAVTLSAKTAQRAAMIANYNAVPNKPGYFLLNSPKFNLAQASNHTPAWTVLDADFKENFQNKPVKPNEAILRLGDKNGPWEIEVKIPQKNIAQVRQAFPANDPGAKLDVDIIVLSEPTKKYKGKLAFDRIAAEATPNKDDHNESTPVVIAYVSLDDPSIPDDDRVPPELLVTGVEVHGKVRCGNHAMGYSLFYGLWEFLYEKVVFFF